MLAGSLVGGEPLHRVVGALRRLFYVIVVVVVVRGGAPVPSSQDRRGVGAEKVGWRCQAQEKMDR